MTIVATLIMGGILAWAVIYELVQLARVRRISNRLRQVFGEHDGIAVKFEGMSRYTWRLFLRRGLVTDQEVDTQWLILSYRDLKDTFLKILLEGPRRYHQLPLRSNYSAGAKLFVDKVIQFSSGKTALRVIPVQIEGASVIPSALVSLGLIHGERDLPLRRR